MLSVTLSATGRTMADVEEEIEAAKERMLAGWGSGSGGNETGSYTFTVDGQDEEDISDEGGPE